jgi:hypothetical protein
MILSWVSEAESSLILHRHSNFLCGNSENALWIDQNYGDSALSSQLRILKQGTVRELLKTYFQTFISNK